MSAETGGTEPPAACFSRWGITMTRHFLSTTAALAFVAAIGAGAATAQTVVTMNTVQIFGTSTKIMS